MTQVNEIRRIENSDVGDPDALIVVRTHRASTSRVRVIYFLSWLPQTILVSDWLIYTSIQFNRQNNLKIMTENKK
jgi:hypothetical protein